MPFQIDKPVMLKTAFLDKPFLATFLCFEGAGMWVKSLEMTSAIQRIAAGVGTNAVPVDKQFLNDYPKLFVPLQQVQWAAGPEMY